MDRTPTTREDIGSTVALIILLNTFFFNNNAFVLLGVSAWMLIWAIATKQFKRENFTTRRAIISGLLFLALVAMAAYMLFVAMPPATPTR